MTSVYYYNLVEIVSDILSEEIILFLKQNFFAP